MFSFQCSASWALRTENVILNTENFKLKTTMKLQFDANQQYQLDAVAAVTELFDGQPQGAPEYSVIQVGEWGGLFTGQARTELGVGNHLLLAPEKLLASARGIQTRYDIEFPPKSKSPPIASVFVTHAQDGSSTRSNALNMWARQERAYPARHHGCGSRRNRTCGDGPVGYRLSLRGSRGYPEFLPL